MIKVKAQESPITKIGTNEKELKYVLKPVYSNTVAEKEIIDFCQSLTQLPRTYIRASLESIIQTMIHYLMLGYKIKFNDLSTFYITADSSAVSSVADAGLSQLKNLYIRFLPNKELSEEVRSAEINLDGIYKIVNYDKKIYEKVKTTSKTDLPEEEDTGGGSSTPDDGGDDFSG